MTSRCVNHVYTLPPKLSSVIKKIVSGSIFCDFASLACILIGKDEECEKMEKRTREFRTQCAMTFSCALLWCFLTLILTAPIHCRGSIGEQVMLDFPKSVEIKKQSHLHLGWSEDEYILANFNFCVNYIVYKKKWKQQ